ncbi:MAG: Na(+)/H(+) antiporter subunit D [Balneolaceae bacterium]
MTTELIFFPALIVIAGAFIIPLLNQKVRSSAFLLFPVAALAGIWAMPENFVLQGSLAGYDLLLVQADSLSRIFATIFAMITLFGGIYAWHIKDLGQQTSALVYAGSALGVVYAGDFFTLIVFWELMAFSSSYLVWARRTEEAQHSGMRYLIVHALGGGILLAGILVHLNDTGSLLLTSFPYVLTPASVLILIGISINAAIPPLHAWLTDAYPKATVTGAVFMSAFTSKSAVYVLIRLFPGWEILIWLGVAMALYGTVYALMANDTRKILSFSIISQIGYMVVAIGIGTEIALNGAAAHAFGHILYKSLLFMGAGAVLYSTGKSKLTELGGLAKKMKWTVVFYMIGGFSISGFPLLNGFISKSLIMEAVGEAHLEMVILLLLAASAGTFLHTGLKLPYFTWFDTPKSEITVKPLPKNMLFAMGIGAFFCILFGIYPALIYNNLPYPVDTQPFTVYNLVEMTQILVFTFIGFWLLRKNLKGVPKIALDTDWFYRMPATWVRRIFVRFPDDLFGQAEKIVLDLSRKLTGSFENPMRWLNPFTDHGKEASTYSPALEVVMSYILLVILVAGLFIIL